jgi:hypothetical protein
MAGVMWLILFATGKVRLPKRKVQEQAVEQGQAAEQGQGQPAGAGD